MPKDRVDFEVYVARTTEHDVISEHVGAFPSLAEAEAALQALAPEWDGGTIYDMLITWDRDELGPIPVQNERSCRNYVKADAGSFELDELIQVAPLAGAKHPSPSPPGSPVGDGCTGARGGSGMTREEFIEHVEAKVPEGQTLGPWRPEPCDCDYDGCDGWVISYDVEAMTHG